MSRNVSAFRFLVVPVLVIFTLAQNGMLSLVKLNGGLFDSFDPDQEQYIVESIRRIVEHTAEAYGATATLEYIKKVPPTINDPAA